MIPKQDRQGIRKKKIGQSYEHTSYNNFKENISKWTQQCMKQHMMTKSRMQE